MRRGEKKAARARVGGGIQLLVVLSLLAACAKSTKPDLLGEVNLNRITPENSARMQLKDNQLFIQGEHTNPELMPAYPVELLPLQLPDQLVCVRFVVNGDGTVSNIKAIHGIVGCPTDADSPRPEFIAATVNAVSRWDYLSSILCTFPPGTPKKCNGPGTTAEHVAVTLAYQFLFSTKSGGTVQRAGVDH